MSETERQSRVNKKRLPGREAPEMFHNLKIADKPHFIGFLLHTITTVDTIVRYGKNNKIDFSEHPTVKKSDAKIMREKKYHVYVDGQEKRIILHSLVKLKIS